MLETTCVIKTLGRPTLENAIRSAKREKLKPLIISDGVPLSKKRCLGCKHVVLGRNWGFYGGMAANVAAALVKTPYITFLDDDDEFIEGAGDIIREKINNDPSVDIWIAGLIFDYEIDLTRNGERVLRSNKLSIYPEYGVSVGNCSMPTYKTEIFGKVPFRDVIPEEHAPLTDLAHVQECQRVGYKVDWFQEVLYHVRPNLVGANGGGQK